MAGTTAHPRTHLVREEDGDRFRGARRAALAVLAAAAVPLVVLSNALLPPLPEEPALALAALPPLADRWLAVTLLYAVASLLYLPFVVVLWGLRARRGSLLRLVGGCLVVVATVSNALSLSTWGYLLWGTSAAGLERGAVLRVLAVMDGSAMTLPISWLAIPVAVLGLLLLTAGVARSRAVPAWAPWTFVIGTVVSAAVGAGPMALLGVVGAAGAVGMVRAAARQDPGRG
ncbi:hypothetical protein CLV92_107140 [Kineococcus xinjiangensis]|uniref:Uncharacterized protein n=1 Tax=Kineococcus xinjiangensis TaxID=512762 RepID=A0A2S6IK85_9ACTN|nr:hypothetical protein [Kineococcus xinjiangensis]PPK94637.1 hypothetical protein CLV92_107140 [Kineococcus xinjiangensis]